MSKIKKLIEVALPLDAINAASAREKSIRHGHPSTLHLWWARRPLATARAVIFASLVDAPSSHPELFPTKEAQDKERKRLFDIIERLVKWENINNKDLFDEAYAEIKKYCGDDIPTLLDPFAGGGTIPLEAQRLGLKAIAADLNPVAVMINKATIEIPPKFADLPPINPIDRSGLVGASSDWHGAMGLAADVSYYGKLLKKKAFEKLEHCYPKVKITETGEEAIVIAWIWARTMTCPNPACGCDMPLVKTFVLSKKKEKEAYIEPLIDGGNIKYHVHKGKNTEADGTVSRTGAKCICCGENVPISYIKEQGKDNKIQSRMMAVIAQGKNGRIYLSPDDIQIKAASVNKPLDVPTAELPHNPRWFSPPDYGMDTYDKIFTNRQLYMLDTFCGLLNEVTQTAYKDALAIKMPDDEKGLNDNGSGALAYSEAIKVYLAFVVDKLVDYHSNICGWHTSRETICHTFGRQAIPMVWDFAEANPFSTSSGCYDNMVEWVTKCIKLLPTSNNGFVKQHNASTDDDFDNVMVSTDPPYYDNIGYADLSDYFDVWLRKSLKEIYPTVLSTLITPKQQELIADPYRIKENNTNSDANNKELAKKFFEDGMSNVCDKFYHYARTDIPVTIYYAFKQNDTDKDGKASTGWETIIGNFK